MTSSDHLPHRPSWDCLACGRSWPCDPAREALAAELDSIGLAVHLWIRLEEAAEDRPDLPPSEFFDRFISWTRHLPDDGPW